MAEIPIVITCPLEKEYLQQITAVDSRLKVLDGWPWMSAEDSGDASQQEAFDALLYQAEILCGFWPPQKVLTRAPRLQWLHTLLTGIDRTAFAEVLNSPVLVSDSTGIDSIQVSEFAMLLMMNLAKETPYFYRMQQGKRWSPAVPGVLAGKTLGIVGLGTIGKAIAKLAKAFGMRVIAVRKSSTEPIASTHVDVLWPAASLPKLLAKSDFVVIAVPESTGNAKMIGEPELRAMKPAAFLINIAHGRIVDEAALIRALKERWISGAGVDTAAIEPLPENSQLWDLPNVIVTPHVSGLRKDYNKLAIPLFCENLRRYLRQVPLLNRIDKKRGY